MCVCVCVLGGGEQGQVKRQNVKSLVEVLFV